MKTEEKDFKILRRFLLGTLIIAFYLVYPLLFIIYNLTGTSEGFKKDFDGVYEILIRKW